MRRIALLLPLSIVLACQRPIPAPQSPPDATWSDYPEADALSYAITLELDPRVARVRGTVDYRFRAVERLDTIRLDSREAEGWPEVLDAFRAWLATL